MLESLPVCIQTLAINNGQNQSVVYPQVTGLQNQYFNSFINHVIVRETQSLIDFQVGNMPSTVEEMIGLYEIKNNQRQVLSLVLSNYTYHYRAAHGMTFLRSLTFDLKEEKQCKLKDLFKSGSNYIERLSSIIKEQIKERDIVVIEEFDKIKPDHDFYLADKTLVIFFQLYELSPYAYGFPMFPISIYDIQDIILEDGPLGRLVASP